MSAIRSWLAGLVLMANTLPALAAFPDKPVRIVVPFPPGGGNDIIVRALTEDMARDLGQQVIVENKPGGGTVIGTEYVATRAPDGYTLLIASFAHAVNPSLLAKLPFDFKTAFASVTLIGRSPNIVAVPAERPWQSFAELIADARANPGKLNYGSFGNGTSSHLGPELLKVMARIDLTLIPYKGSSQGVTDMLGGRLDMMFSTLTGAAAHVRSGKLRALAVTSAARSPAYPDVPAIAEAGVPGYDSQTWYGILAPAGTPPDIVARLHATIVKAADTDQFRKKAAEDGLVLDLGNGAALDTLIDGEHARWARVVKEAGIKPD